jgi:hypothetical protein
VYIKGRRHQKYQLSSLLVKRRRKNNKKNIIKNQNCKKQLLLIELINNENQKNVQKLISFFLEKYFKNPVDWFVREEK